MAPVCEDPPPPPGLEDEVGAPVEVTPVPVLLPTAADVVLARALEMVLDVVDVLLWTWELSGEAATITKGDNAFGKEGKRGRTSTKGKYFREQVSYPISEKVKRQGVYAQPTNRAALASKKSP